MKKIIVTCCCFMFALMGVFAQNTQNMSLLAKWDDATLKIGGAGGQKYSGCWGMALNGREYAIIGSLEFTIIVDITTPAEPKMVGKFSGVNCIWREFKTYKNRIYVSNDCGGGLQIIDMTHAPDSIKMTYNSKELVSSMHTITLDTTSGRIYGNSVPVVMDVSANPDRPVLLSKTFSRCLQAHDTYVRNDTIYSSTGTDGYWICDYTNPLSPKDLAVTTTSGYNHNSWLTRDGRYAYYTEEIPDGRPIQILDLTDLKNGNIEVVGSFFDQLIPSPPTNKKAIAHNLYIKDDLLFNSQYEDGLLVYDIREPLKPKLVAWYDTYHQNVAYNDYRGCWGNYPWLPSGTIVASDMRNGLFLLKLNYTVSTQPVLASTADFDISPNPVVNTCQIVVSDDAGAWQYQISDVNGHAVRQGQQPVSEINWQGIPQGVYFLKITTENGVSGVKKVLKI